MIVKEYLLLNKNHRSDIGDAEVEKWTLGKQCALELMADAKNQNALKYITYELL